jgi:hypothetical protein
MVVMAESKKAKAHRLEKLREERRLKRERTRDTPQAEAERRNAAATERITTRTR